MGKRKHIDKIEALLEKSPVISFASVERIIGKRGKNSYAKLLIANLLKKRKIIKLAKGYYTKHEDISLAVFCFKPSYLGLQSALSHHGIWGQETIPIIVTTKKVRTGIRKIEGSNVLVRRLDKKYFFGFNYEKEGEWYIPYSDLEKTVLDFILFKQKISDGIVKRMLKKVDRKKLERYVKAYPKKIREGTIVKKFLEKKHG